MDHRELAQWDPVVTRQVKSWAGPIMRWWFRSEVRGLQNIPDRGAALVVADHSGGMLTPDVLIFAPAFYHHFGYDRPLYTLAHYGVLIGPAGALLRRLGVIHASRENAAAALDSGAVVLVFPGGDCDAYRPTFGANTIDFNGRTGYVRTALTVGVPIVPTVSIGAQESQLFITRGSWLAKRLGLPRTAGHLAAERRGALRAQRDLAAQSAAAHEGRHRSPAADRHHRPIRCQP